MILRATQYVDVVFWEGKTDRGGVTDFGSAVWGSVGISVGVRMGSMEQLEIFSLGWFDIGRWNKKFCSLCKRFILQG